MMIMNPVEMAKMAVASRDVSVIVIEVANDGSATRWQRSFPSLPPAALDRIEEATFIAFDSWLEAAEAFQRITSDCVTAGDSLLVGKVTLVCNPFDEDDGCETHAWDLSNDARPVFRDLIWKREPIPGRD